MEIFESLLSAEQGSVERFVRFRIPEQADADDVLQEVYLAAYLRFSQLKNRSAFKPWLLSIARNKCHDYFRKKAAQYELPIEELAESELSDSRNGVAVVTTVRETLDRLGDRDKQILYLYYWKELPQAQIATHLGIPVGTVKSRLHKAKQNFKANYPHHTTKMKGDRDMKHLPQYLPEYRIEASNRPPFSVKWEELSGYFLIPRLGESCSWGMYDLPSRKCSHIYEMRVIGQARVHGIEGVEITAREAAYSDRRDVTNRTIVAQLTDTHCRYLATFRTDGGVRNYLTFLDGEEFMRTWGYGEDNCGNETDLRPAGKIRRTGATVVSEKGDYLIDIVGRYTVTVNGQEYDTVCVMNIEEYDCGVVSEQYLDENGKTVLWRRFNRNDWAMEHYQIPWTEQLPDNERLMINGELYVHWYDCITDYIL